MDTTVQGTAHSPQEDKSDSSNSPQTLMSSCLEFYPQPHHHGHPDLSVAFPFTPCPDSAKNIVVSRMSHFTHCTCDEEHLTPSPARPPAAQTAARPRGQSASAAAGDGSHLGGGSHLGDGHVVLPPLLPSLLQLVRPGQLIRAQPVLCPRMRRPLCREGGI